MSEDTRRAIVQPDGRTWPRRRPKWRITLMDGAMRLDPDFPFVGTACEAQQHARRLIDTYLPRALDNDETMVVYPRGYHPTVGPKGPAGCSEAWS